MATSGTSVFTLDLLGIMQEAFERCGLDFRTGYDWVTGRRSIDLLMIEWGNRQVNLWQLESVSLSLVAGTATYDLGEDTIDICDDGAIRTFAGNTSLQSDIGITRIGWDDYLNLPNKLQTGQPVNFVVSRNTAQPTVTFWPVPDSVQSYAFHYYRLRRIEDTGTNPSNTMDVPFRFLPALIAGLAAKIAQKKAPDRYFDLKAEYEEVWRDASTEDRERAGTTVVPYVGRF